MRTSRHINLIFSVLWMTQGDFSISSNEETTSQGNINELSSAVPWLLDFTRFYSEDDPKGIPMVYIPDPLGIPLAYNLTTSLSISDQALQGLSQIRLHTVIVDMVTSKVHAEANLPHVNMYGQYVWLAAMMWDDDTYGTTNITMTDVDLTLDFQVSLNSEGALQLKRENVEFLLKYGKLSADFQNLSTMYVIMARVAFPALMPSLQDWVEDWLHETLSLGVGSAAEGIIFPDSVPWVDFMLILVMMWLFTLVRSCINQIGFDPLPIGSFWIDIGSGFALSCEDVQLMGLATLYRLGDLQAKLIDNTLSIVLQIGVQSAEMLGLCGSPLSFMGGSLQVRLESIGVTIEVHQRTHLRSPPTLRELKIDIGNFEIRSSAFGTLAYLIESMANIFPNLLRSSIISELEPLLWKVLQEKLNMLDFSAAVTDALIQHEKALDREGNYE